MASTEYTAEIELTATRVADADRLRVLPQYCGARYMIATENAVYNWMSCLVTGYEVGLWDFYEVSNGTFFMVPCGEKNYNVEFAPNYYSGQMSAEAVGITATLYALNQMANHTAQHHIIELYYALREFAKAHFESAEIMRAID